MFESRRLWPWVLNRTMKKNVINFFLAWLISLDLAHAQTIQSASSELNGIINLFYPIILSLAILFFIWGVGRFILNAGDSKLREDGKQKMIWGIIAVFVVLSLFGIVQLLGNVFDLDTCTNPNTCFAPN
jgi:uncharacterized membrane protein